jgi:nucleoside transporter
MDASSGTRDGSGLGAGQSQPWLARARASLPKDYERLAVMMFLQFFVWGAWYLSVSMYMYAHGMGAVRYYAYTAGPLAAIISPFITGMIADRFFNTERILGILFLLAGVFMLLLPAVGAMQGTPVEFQESNGQQIAVVENVTLYGLTMSKGNLFNGLILCHMLCYMPTLGLTASLSFHHLERGAQQFPLVRLWGTIGWIVAGLILAFCFTSTVGGKAIEAGTRAVQFVLGGGASVLLGLYSFSLPKTPPPKAGHPIDLRDLLFLDAWAQFRSPSFAVFILCSFLVCIPLAAYYASLQQQMLAMGMDHITAWKNVGTFVEAGMMFAMPWFFRKLGIKYVIAIGILAWVVRYVCFALGASTGMTATALVIFGIALHGFCYDFFFVSGQVYVDMSTPSQIRGQCQGMNIFFTQGSGMVIGAMVAQKLERNAFGSVASISPESLDLWPKRWWPLCGMAAGVLVVFLAAFHAPASKPAEAPKAA